MKEIKGDLIKLARQGNFDMIVHGCNCFCRMGSGIAKQVAVEIPDAVRADKLTKPGDINKLGNYTTGVIFDYENNPISIIYNCYTQYGHNPKDKPFIYEALTLCLRKINHTNKGKTIGLPLIGAGLAGGKWDIIKEIIRTELKDMDVTIVHFEK
ncbi:MAG: macro domain-containing protein [bacterium]